MNAGRPPLIVQARMGSTRLLGKAMLELVPGRAALDLMLERVARCTEAGPPVVAATTAPEDGAIGELCRRLGVACFRGSAEDVLDRVYRCALELGPPDAVVRLTGDCPLHDPAVIDQVVQAFHDSEADYASNVAPPAFPDGLDVEVLRFAALERAWLEAKRPSEREHVTPYLRNHPELFSTINVGRDPDLSLLRWTLDEEADLAFMRVVYAELYEANPAFSMDDVLELLRRRPELTAINSHVGRNEGYLRSLEEDARHGA